MIRIKPSASSAYIRIFIRCVVKRTFIKNIGICFIKLFLLSCFYFNSWDVFSLLSQCLVLCATMRYTGWKIYNWILMFKILYYKFLQYLNCAFIIFYAFYYIRFLFFYYVFSLRENHFHDYAKRCKPFDHILKNTI